MLVQPVCKGCGQPTGEAYITALGAAWHPEHFRCTVCGRPIRDTGFSQYQGKPCHVECYDRHFVPRCAYCAKPLSGQYLVDHWGAKFCAIHEKEYRSCVFCGRLVEPSTQAAPRPTARVRCSLCQASAVESLDRARFLFQRVVDWVYKEGLTYNQAKLRLDLVEAVAGGQCEERPTDPHTLGTTSGRVYAVLGIKVTTAVDDVAIVRGLPATLFQAVTAHELGHVWLIDHGITGLPRWGEEGLCEVLAHRLLEQTGTPESHYHALNIEQNNDAVYGEGFRRARSLVDARGFHRFIESLQSTKRWPA